MLFITSKSFIVYYVSALKRIDSDNMGTVIYENPVTLYSLCGYERKAF